MNSTCIHWCMPNPIPIYSDLTLYKKYLTHILHNWNKDDLTDQKHGFPWVLWNPLKFASLLLKPQTLAKTSVKVTVSLKACMNAMPCRGRESTEVSSCQSLLCHARQWMNLKHAASLCTLVLELACTCSFASSACERGENNKSPYNVIQVRKGSGS